VSNVKKNNFKNSLFIALCLSSSVAGADQKYPAADFQPSVVYQDADYIAKNSESSPGSNKTSSNTAVKAAADPKYPASNFEPKVVYNDPGYKQSESSASTASSVQGTSSAESSEADATSSKDGDSLSSYLIGLVLFAVVGFVLFKRRPESKSPASTRVFSKDTTGLTGVARYLNRSAGTGVARYLEKQVKSASASAATGVAKYMAKQGASGNTTNVKAKTGVEKYMRDRG
jgi:hypothetical protein